MSRKSQSQKKRHTKPCRYFQVNKCPHPADVCDFAHVLVSPVIGSPIGHGPFVNGYCYGDQCLNGASCTCYRNGAAELWSPSSVDANYPDSPPPLYGAFSPFTSTWPTSTFSSSLFLSFGDTMGRNLSGRSDSVDTTSNSLSSSELEDSSIITEDPRYVEHHHEHQSRIQVVDDSPVIHVQPFQLFSYKNMTPIQASGLDMSYATLNGSILPPSLKPRTKVSKQKVLKYKTKPCKFFPTERGCPNGEACTFIHDEPQFLSRLAISMSKEAKEEPPKEDLSRKSFVPIPWRVIGGGVLVGVQKDHMDPPPPAHDEDEQTPDTPSTKPKKIVSPIKIVSRQRSNSIPSTPSVAQINVGHLFPAESPGVL